MRLGIWQPAAPSDFSNLYALETAIGRQVDIIPWYQAWDGGNSSWKSSAIQTVHARNDIPMITWEPWNTSGGTTQSSYTMASILAGNHDTYIEGWASAAAGENGVILIRLMHEMNGDWYPWGIGENGTTSANHKAAFAYVVQKFRDAGADNVQFVWCPNRQDTGSGLSDHYPGDEWVDWLGIDGYNWGTTGGQSWKTFAQVFGATYTALAGISDKKIIICETASSSTGGDQAQWITDSLDLSTLAGDYPQIDGIIWFNEDANSDWTFSDDQDSVDAFAAEVADWGSAPRLYISSDSVAAQGDDGYTYGSSTLDASAARFSAGSKQGLGNYNAFVRIPLNVPSKGTATQTRLEMYSFADASALGGTADIFAVLDTDADAPTTFNEVVSGPFTTASVRWDVPATPTAGEPVSTPDLSPIINEIISQGGWQSGNHILLAILRNQGYSSGQEDGYGRFAAHEHATLPPPKLVTTYTLPEPGTGYYLSFTPTDTYSTDTDELTWEVNTASDGSGVTVVSGTATSGVEVNAGWVSDAELVGGSNTRYLILTDGAGNTDTESFVVVTSVSYDESGKQETLTVVEDCTDALSNYEVGGEVLLTTVEAEVDGLHFTEPTSAAIQSVHLTEANTQAMVEEQTATPTVSATVTDTVSLTESVALVQTTAVGVEDYLTYLDLNLSDTWTAVEAGTDGLNRYEGGHLALVVAQESGFDALSSVEPPLSTVETVRVDEQHTLSAHDSPAGIIVSVESESDSFNYYHVEDLVVSVEVGETNTQAHYESGRLGIQTVVLSEVDGSLFHEETDKLALETVRIDWVEIYDLAEDLPIYSRIWTVSEVRSMIYVESVEAL